MTISDVARPRGIGIVAVVAALATAGAWLLYPEVPERRSGALAPTHRDLECSSCHGEEPATSACVGCHGPHPSRRPAHRRLARAGRLGCNRCHDVHGSDQGVRLGRESARYAVGRERQVEPAGALEAIVPLVPARRCTDGCHRLRAGDPIQRCVAVEASRSSGCFDEHRDGLEVGAEEGVCAVQHGPRFAAWEAARLVAARVPAPRPRPSRASIWALSGLGGAGLAALFGLVGGWWSRRRERLRREADAEGHVPRPAERRRLPVIDPTTCLGCYACVDACPYDVLRIERYVAVVDHPEACCGLTLCEQVCPNGSLTMREGEPVANVPRLDDHLEARGVPGLFLAGDITGVPLIKTAILQGRLAIEGAAERPRGSGETLDVVVVGAGPAGISAALRAKELGLRYRVIEQGSVAQSIRSFPRGKLVFDQPLELPLAGKLWLERSTKEELLAKWLRIVRAERLAIDEQTRFVGVEEESGAFAVEARDGHGDRRRYRTANLVLAIGTRGTPRRLDLQLPEDVTDKVFYSLADARSFAGCRVLVVGLGDVAMETAIALSGQPGTDVTIAYRGEAMKRGKARNRDQVARLAQAGRLTLLYRAELSAVQRDHVVLRVGDARRRLPNDAIFVMIGNLSPRPLLEDLGVRFGEGMTAGEDTG